MSSTATTTATTDHYGRPVIPAQSVVIVHTLGGGRVAGRTMNPTIEYTSSLGELGASVPAIITLDTGWGTVESYGHAHRGFGGRPAPSIISIELVTTDGEA